MIQSMLRAITSRYHLNAITLGEFTHIKVNGAGYQLWAFHADGLGHVSAIVGSGIMGLTKTEALVIVPTEKDMPLFSYDRILTMGSDTMRCDLFDTLLENCDLSRVEAVCHQNRDLPGLEEAHWFDPLKLPTSFTKRSKRASGDVLDSCAMAYLEAFLETAELAPYCEPNPKKDKTDLYVEGVLTNGHPSIDLFRKHLGPEKNDILLRSILFGTVR